VSLIAVTHTLHPSVLQAVRNTQVYALLYLYY